MTPEVVAQLPMAMPEETIGQVVFGLLVCGSEPAAVAEALIGMSDRQALHCRPFPVPVKAAVSGWLERVWRVDDVRFVDAAATLVATLGIARFLLERTAREGPPATREIAEETLAELRHGDG